MNLQWNWQLNWKVRLKNKAFWLAVIPAVCLLAQQVLALAGVQWQFQPLAERLTAVVNAAFAVLAILGVVADPTTPGLSDSERAMGYREPGGEKAPQA